MFAYMAIQSECMISKWCIILAALIPLAFISTSPPSSNSSSDARGTNNTYCIVPVLIGLLGSFLVCSSNGSTFNCHGQLIAVVLMNRMQGKQNVLTASWIFGLFLLANAKVKTWQVLIERYSAIEWLHCTQTRFVVLFIKTVDMNLWFHECRVHVGIQTCCRSSMHSWKLQYAE